MRNGDSNSGRVFFLDSPVGIEKKVFVESVAFQRKMHKKISIFDASSGIAATLLDCGKTAHSVFTLPINLNFTETSLWNISKQSNVAHVLKELKECKLIVWDEPTMAHKEEIEALDRTL